MVPIAGDTAKAVSKLGKFAIKNLDNVVKVADVVEFTSKYYPDAVKLLAKNDDFVSAAKAMSNNTSLKMTKADAERINKILEDAGLSEYAIKSSTEVIKLSKNNIQHIKKHTFEGMAEQAKYLTDEQLANKLANTTFFNKNWSQDEVVKYTQEAYNTLRGQGKIGLHSVEINGEIINVYIKDDGAFDTAYGVYQYTVDDFR